MPATGLLALLRLDLPRTRHELAVLQDKEQTGQDLVELYSFARRLHTTTSIPARLLHLRAYLTSLDEGRQQPLTRERDTIRLHKNLCTRLGVVRGALQKVMKGYVPDHIWALIFPDMKPPTEDIISLAMLGFRSDRDDPQTGAEQRACFEAQRDFILALVNYDQLERGKWIGSRRTGQDFYAVMKYLVGMELLPDTPPRKGTLISSYHEKQNLFRAAWVEHLDASPPPYTTSLTLRTTRLHSGYLQLANRAIPVLVQVRRKGFLQTIGKWLAEGGLGRKGSSLDIVHDRRGLCIAYSSHEDLEAGAQYLREQTPFNPALGAHWERYRTTPSPSNPFSAANFRSISYFRLLAGRRFQIQHRLGHQHLDLIYSRGPENHTLYHLRQYTTKGGLFDWLFPFAIYEINWQAPQIVEACTHHILASLPR